ncbi:MAG: ABC transporter ATP-binding protein [Campylobacterota bacterium]
MIKVFKVILARFWPYMVDYKGKFALAVVGMVLAALGTAGSAYAIKPILDDIFVEKNKELLYLVPFFIVLAYFAKGLGVYLQSYFMAYIGNDIVRRLRNLTLSNLLKLELDFFHKYRKGELISRIVGDVEQVKAAVSTMLPMMIRESLTIVALVFVLIFQSPTLAFLALFILPVAILPIRLLNKKMKTVTRQAQEKIADTTSILGEIFNNIEIIKVNTNEDFESKKYEKDNQEYFRYTMKTVKSNELVSPVMETVGALGAALVVIIGGLQVIEEQMSVGSFFSFMAAMFMLYTPLKRVTKQYNQLHGILAAVERMNFLLDLKADIVSGSQKVGDINKIEGRDVRLQYGDIVALEGVDFEAKKGEVVAFVGDSGGGKSSLVNLLVRFYDCEGSLSYDGVDIKQLDLKALRDATAMVTQRVYVFNDSVAANVAYGEPIDEDRVIEALQNAEAMDFVEGLSEGIHTKLDEFGVNLSGGQRQRIAIARAFYKDPQVLIFDEATSALDNKSERAIAKAMRKLQQNRITFIIAHRLSTIEHADRIYVFKEGKIVCVGDDAQLLNECAEYQRLKGTLLE